MTGPSTDRVICYQCGTSNAAGDQFCGNCGVFLEWSPGPAASTSRAVAPGAAAPDSDASLAGSLEQPTTQAPVAAPRGSPQLVRCPTCGTANEAGKTFCLKCGNKLAGATVATRLPLPPRSEPAASPAVGSSAASKRDAVRRRESAKEGGGSGWLLVGGAGIAVGAVIVAIVLLLGSGKPPPPAAASSAPSASVAASHAPSAKPSAGKPAKTAKPKPSK
jgi:hypothetical protein